MKSENDHIELDKVWSYNRIIHHLHDRSVSITQCTYDMIQNNELDHKKY